MKRPSLRAYLLLEVLVASAIISVALSFAIIGIAQARAMASQAGERERAAVVARQKIDELMVKLAPDGTGGEPDQAAFIAVPGETRLRFQWSTVDVAAAVAPVQNPARELSVTVEYSAALQSPEDRATPPTGDGKASLLLQRLWIGAAP